MTIHSGHPFATPPELKDAARRLRGRTASTVTLWAAGAGRGRAGLTVSSSLVVLGEPARLIGFVDPHSELADALEDGRAAVSVLAVGDAAVADAFAGLAPSPGGPFRVASFEQSAWGAVLAARTWCGLRVESTRPMGWSTEVVGVVEHIEIADVAPPLLHWGGRYASVGG